MLNFKQLNKYILNNSKVYAYPKFLNKVNKFINLDNYHKT